MEVGSLIRGYFIIPVVRMLCIVYCAVVYYFIIVTTRWFYGKKRKIGKGIFLTENRLSRNEMWCAADNYNNMCHYVQKSF